MVDVEQENAVPSDAEKPEEEKKGGDEVKAEATDNKTSLDVQNQLDAEMLEEKKEYTDDEFEEFAKMYDETLSDFVEGEVVEGRILAIGDKEVAVDVGFKSEGTIPIEEFSDPKELKVGDSVEVVLDQMEDQDGQLVLSKRKADFMKIWEKVRESHEKGEIIQGKCVRRIKGGMVVDLNGVDAFLPGSQIDVRPIRDFDSYIGKTLDLKVVKVNNIRKNIVVSHRVLVEEEMAGQRNKILTDLDRGQVLTGTVKNITNFGVFIDLGGVDGLLHINDLSWGRVGHPSEVVSLDQEIKVVVLEFNEEKNRISLGYKQLQPHPWEEVDKKYPVDSIVTGKVVSISDYGAFVELEKGVEGLIHISEMSWTQHIKHPSKILTVGEIVEARVLSVQKEERKISLGLKQLQPDPWETLAERYPVGSIHTGKVRNLTNFGAFIELEEGIDGLVHISDLSWTKKVRHPGEIVKKGDEIQVIVMKVDPDNRRISLGFKQTQENPWERFEELYKPGTFVKGKVVRLIEKGLLVEMPEEVDGFVPLSHLAKEGIVKPADGYKLEDELELCVIEFSKDNKRIVLSEKRAIEKLPDDTTQPEMEDTSWMEEIDAIESQASMDESQEGTPEKSAPEKTTADAEPEVKVEQPTTEPQETAGVEVAEEAKSDEKAEKEKLEDAEDVPAPEAVSKEMDVPTPEVVEEKEKETEIAEDKAATEQGEEAQPAPPETDQPEAEKAAETATTDEVEQKEAVAEAEDLTEPASEESEKETEKKKKKDEESPEPEDKNK